MLIDLWKKSSGKKKKKKNIYIAYYKDKQNFNKFFDMFSYKPSRFNTNRYIKIKIRPNISIYISIYIYIY